MDEMLLQATGEQGLPAAGPASAVPRLEVVREEGKGDGWRWRPKAKWYIRMTPETPLATRPRGWISCLMR